METPKTQLHLRKAASPAAAAAPIAYSVADMVLPTRIAPPEITGDGALLPAVIVAIGQVGLEVLREFRKLAQERFGMSDRLPNIKTNFIDTQSETLQAAPSGGPRTASAASSAARSCSSAGS